MKQNLLQTILEIVRSHYQETKLFNQHLTGNNEEGNESVPDDVCQSKQELEEIKELVDIHQMHKTVSEGMKDGRMLRDTETQSEKREMREGITQKDEKGENKKGPLNVEKHVQI